MKFLTSCLLVLSYLIADICFAVTISELKPVHPRPFLLPENEKKHITNLTENEAWAKQEWQNLQQKAKAGDGYSAAFLYALTNETEYLQTAKTWLLDFTKKGADLGGRALKVNDDFFDQGMPWLGDVFYRTNTQYLEAYDFIYNGLSEAEKSIILTGINASADFRVKSMDAWWQTANLVFKPTSMVAIAGLVTQNPRYLDWGFFRKPNSSVGGYFSALETMLKDNGPWHEAPIYAVAHLPLYQSLKTSDFLSRMTGQDWFNRKLDRGSSISGLMNYYINTTYPAELRSDENRDYRILTFGDGATGQRGDHYLINHNPFQRNLSKELSLAYKLSKNPEYAALLKLSSEYSPNLIDKPKLPEAPFLPKAPSSIWPDFGLAFLRSDNSRNYWKNPDAIAASLLFRQGYGHGHADALSLTLFAAGQLFYPDYNAVQYENPAIGWTTSSVAHNTVVVDGNNSLIPKNVTLKHEFNDKFRFVQAEADEPLGLTKKRTLALTTSYLLDVFHLNSLTPRTYDYLLHSFGEIETKHPGGYVASKPFSTRYNNIKGFKTLNHNDSWELDFVIDADRKLKNTTRIIEKFNRKKNSEAKLKQGFGLSNLDSFKTSKLNLKMSGHPNTKIGLGEDQYGLSFLAVRRENVKHTSFISLHSPYIDQPVSNTPNSLETIFESNQGMLLKVTTEKYIDLHAISHGQNKIYLNDTKTNTAIAFADYALIRVHKKSKQVETHGELDAYVIAANLIGAEKDIKYGQLTSESIEQIPQALSLSITASPELIILKDFEESVFTLSLTNKTSDPISLKINLPENPLFQIPKSHYRVDQIPAHETEHLDIKLGRYIGTGSIDFLPIDITVKQSNEKYKHGVMVSPGPGLIRQYEQLEEPAYRIHTFDSSIDFSMRHGLINRIADDNSELLFESESLFYLSDGKTVFSPKDKTISQSYTWADQNNASIISEINNLIRWHVFPIQNRFYVKLDPVYTQLEKAFFVFDKSNQEFDWGNISFFNGNGPASSVKTDNTEFTGTVVELPFKNSNKSLCIKTTHSKSWINNNTQLSFSLTRDTKDQFRFGLCQKGSLTN